MGWSGGIFTRVHDWTEDEAGGYDILSTRFDEEDDNFEAGINNCLTKDGTNSPTADLPMGTRKHTGVGSGTARDHYATVGQVQDGAFKYNTASNNLNAYVLSVSPAPNGYTAGQQFNFKPTNTNSGATTLNVNSLGAKDVYFNNAPCTEGTIVGGRIYSVIYDGTRFHLVSGGGSSSGASYGGALIFLNSSQDLEPGGAFTIIDFRGEAYDDSAYHPTSANYLSIPVTGRYRITAAVNIDNYTHTLSGDSLVEALLTCNGSHMGSSYCNADISWVWGNNYYTVPSLHVVWEGPLTATDAIRLEVRQKNTSGLWLTAYGNGLVKDSCYMAIERIK